MVPHTAPTAGVFVEFGLLPVEHLINQRKLMFLRDILNLNENDRVLFVYNEQQNFINETNNIRKLYSINPNDSEIKCFNKIKLKELVKKNFKDYIYTKIFST